MLENSPEGLSTRELACASGVRESRLVATVRQLRAEYASGDSGANVITFTDEFNVPKYQLVSRKTLEYFEYLVHNIRHARGSLVTLAEVTKSVSKDDHERGLTREAERVDRLLGNTIAELGYFEELMASGFEELLFKELTVS